MAVLSFELILSLSPCPCILSSIFLQKDDHMIHREDGTVEMIGFDIFMDHSCDPNLNQTYHTKTNYTVTANRDIKAGDKLTCDYQALMNQVTGSKSLVTTQFECRCGTAICRGLVLA